MIKRIFLIVVDGLGIGELPDAEKWGDQNSNTFNAIINTKLLKIPTLSKLGLGNVDGVKFQKCLKPIGSFGRFGEISNGKDTTVGHFEMMGIKTEVPFPTFPNGFPKHIIQKIEKSFGCKVLCNKPYSGTEVIKDFGQEHIKTKFPIVYTSADSVLQIATHQDVYSVNELYALCRIARNLMVGKWGVNRVIARPFAGEYPNFYRTDFRMDFALPPPSKTALEVLKDNNFEVISVGKINDVFAGQGITKVVEAHNNDEVGEALKQLQDIDFNGLCFANFNDFDSKFGHRNDCNGYALCLNNLDKQLKVFIDNMRDEDVLIITSDHGNDPSTSSTDHSREFTFCLIYGKMLKQNINLGTRFGLFDISATILEMFKLDPFIGQSFFNNIKKP